MDVLFHKDMQWIKLDVINALFADLKELRINDITLSPEIFEDILDNYSKMSFNRITICRVNWGQVKEEEYNQYKSVFEQLGVTLSELKDPHFSFVSFWWNV